MVQGLQAFQIQPFQPRLFSMHSYSQSSQLPSQLQHPVLLRALCQSQQFCDYNHRRRGLCQCGDRRVLGKLFLA